MPPAEATGCEFCSRPCGEIVWRDSRLRVVAVDEPGYPGFCRVVWNAHVREMTDLAPDDRAHLMRVVFAVESAVRALMAPEKVNLASLGNLVSHLHWHVIPRFRDDPHFPQPVWAPARREPRPVEHALPPGALAAAVAHQLDG
jgi:diadenosine tetraphosphate (Ap4A) HIT family hydrolase